MLEKVFFNATSRKKEGMGMEVAMFVDSIWFIITLAVVALLILVIKT
jgi:hypothetical protein